MQWNKKTTPSSAVLAGGILWLFGGTVLVEAAWFQGLDWYSVFDTKCRMAVDGNDLEVVCDSIY